MSPSFQGVSPRHLIGATLLRFNQWREVREYRASLHNGRQVWMQRRSMDSGSRESIVSALDFKNGPCFSVPDGPTAAYTFTEIFLEEHYPRELLDGAKTIIDVGANIGLFSYYARLQAPDARIISFEADPTTFDCLQNNVSALGVECHHKAIAARDGSISFFCSSTSGWSSMFPKLGATDGKQVTVAATSLSSFLRSASINLVDFLKIDVEGAEYDILLGDGGLREVDIKTLVVEADRNPRDARYTFEQLRERLRSQFKTVQERKLESEYPMLICTQNPQ